MLPYFLLAKFPCQTTKNQTKALIVHYVRNIFLRNDKKSPKNICVLAPRVKLHYTTLHILGGSSKDEREEVSTNEDRRRRRKKESF